MRASMDEAKLEELADSIRQFGVLQPLIVTPHKDVVAAEEREGVAAATPAPAIVAQRYVIVAGHRRYMASGLAGLDALPCVLLDAERVSVPAAMLHENVCREDVTAAEEAILFSKLYQEYEHDEAGLARVAGKKPAYIYARLALLDGCPEVFKALADRKINFGVAQKLNTVEDLGYRRVFLQRAIDAGASLRQVQMWVDGYRETQLGAQPAAAAPTNGAAPAAVGPEMPHCFVCDRSDAPYNLVLVHICRTEIEWLDKCCRTAGVKPPEAVIRI